MLAAAMALSLAACKDDSNDSGTITISGEAMNPVFTSAGGTYTVEFTADNEWRVAVPNTNHYTWSSVTPTSGGAGKNQVTVTALRNPGPDGREYSFDLRCGLDSKTIKVTQKQLNSITVTPGSFDIPKEGGSIDIKVVSNIDFDYKIADDAKEWISAVTTKGLVENTVTFAVASNEIYNKFEARQGFRIQLPRSTDIADIFAVRLALELPCGNSPGCLSCASCFTSRRGPKSSGGSF